MDKFEPRIFVLGSFVMACCAGVAAFPNPGESLQAASFEAEPGGKGFNVAVGARRLGAAVDCMIAVGDDLFGRLAEPALARSGLSSDFLRRCKTATGAGIGFVQANGENCLAVFPGANLDLSAEDVRAAANAIRDAAMVVAQFEIAEPPILEAFTLARRTGHATLLNPSPFRPPSAALLARTTVLVVNEREALALANATGCAAGADTFEPLSGALHQLGVETLIVTLGERGVIAFPRAAPPLRHAAFIVDAIDTLGAGDAFTAAFAASLIAELPLSDALRRAAAAGALMTTKAGTFDAFPSRPELDAFVVAGRQRV